MKNTKVKIVKTIALSVIAAAMTAYALPVNAETADTDITKKEDVFVVVNTDGSVNKITVSDTLHSDNGFHNYDDRSALTDAQNLKSTDALTKSSDGYVWNTEDKDIYYQGSYTGDLPLTVAIHYTLDGQSINEEDLLGKSGHVQIVMDLSNNKYQFYKVNGKTYKVAMPIAAVAGAVLNKDVFQNVTVNVGNVTSDSSHDIVASVTLPGMKDSLNSILTAKSLDSLDAYLNDEIVIDADAQNYEAPEVMLAASTDTDELKTELGGTDLASVWGDIDKLQSATNELIDGTKALYDGASQLADGSVQLQSGAESLVSGSAALAQGASQLSAGADSLENGLSQLSGKSAELNAGAKKIEDGVFASASSQINASANANVTLTASNYADVLASLLEINATEREAAKKQIKDTLEAASGIQVSDQTVNALIYMASIHSSGNGFEKDVAAQAARLQTAQRVQTYAATYTTKDAVLKDPTAAAVLNAIVQMKTASTYVLSDSEYAATRQKFIAQYRAGAQGAFDSYSDDQVMQYVLAKYYGSAPEKTVITGAFKKSLNADAVYDAVGAQLLASNKNLSAANIAMLIAYTADTYQSLDTTSFASTEAAITDAALASQEMATALTEGQQKIESTLNVLVASSKTYQDNKQQLADLQSSLDGMVAFVEGLRTYTDGVDQAYAGSQQVAEGASSVAAGATQLNAGAVQLKNGIDQLSEGISTLKDGAETLMEGMTQYNSDGISKLTGSTEISDLKNADELLKQMKQSGEDYNNFTGISDGTSGSVKFVYKVKTVKSETSSAAVSSNTDVTHVNDGSNFWSRLVNLFVFWK